jgi:hypothetical protein
MMKLTQKFIKEAQGKVRSMIVWGSSAQAVNADWRLHRNAADIEHCAHVAEYFSKRCVQVQDWAQEAREEVAGLGLINA